MKKLLFFFFLVCTSLSFAQSPLQYGVVTDYPLLIATIFGIECGGVHNVQVTGNAHSIGHFQHGQAIGLNSGLIMSTGSITQYDSPNTSPNFGVDVGTAGDVDITNYGGTNSFNAIVVEFDFSPASSDTIKFPYVFASEEYPEYVGSQFTDRFLFLVSENGETPVNVALVPGTTNTAVEINSISPTTNAVYYVDNTSSSNPNSTVFLFDGYTVPLLAKFNVTAGSSYHIKLVIADVGDGIYDSAIFLGEQQTYNTVSGILDVNGLPGSGVLEVFNYTQDTVFATPVDSIVVTGGSYLVDSVPTGLYHLRFTPDPIQFPNTPPVYFTSGNNWGTATAIGLPCLSVSPGLSSDSLDVLNGNGSIAGAVIIDTSFLKSLNVALSNATVLLYETTSGQLAAFTHTDESGTYVFNGVPDGHYYILLDVPYLPQLNHHYIDLNENNQQTGVDFAIQGEGIHATGTSSVKPSSDLAVYPNPTNGQLKIFSTSDQFSFSMTDVNGKLLLSDSGKYGGATVNMEHIAPGVYLLHFSTGKTLRVVKN